MATLESVIYQTEAIPIIVISGYDGLSVALEAVRIGAQDYLTKGQISGSLVARSIYYSIERFHLTKQLERSVHSMGSLQDSLQNVVLSHPQGIVLVDGDGVVLLANAAVEPIFGMRCDQLNGTRLDIPIGDVNPQEVEITRQDGQGVVVEVQSVETSWLGQTAFIVACRDVSEHKQNLEALERGAHFDQLTGIGNRALFLRHLHSAIQRYHELGTAFAVLFIDIDRFKDINDALGHPFGDRLLIAVAARLRSVVRRTDTLGRFGGDEFVILADDCHNTQRAEGLAQRVLDAMTEPFLIERQELRIGASVGIAVWNTDFTSPDEILARADMALYQAKERGRGRFSLFEHDMEVKALDRLSMSNELRSALESQDELELHYQPEIDIETGTIVCFEGLLRWRHPVHGYIPPARFIELAEHLGLMAALGTRVTELAVADLAQWRADGLVPVRVAINVSPFQLLGHDFERALLEILDHFEVDPGMIELELTETALTRSSDAVAEMIKRLQSAGVGLAIDDFGCGYSSFARLREFRFSKLKIAGEFMGSADEGVTDRALFQAMSHLGQELGMTVLAEGVETKSQLSFLRELACPLAQGFLFSKAVPAHQVPELLRISNWVDHVGVTQYPCVNG